MGGLKLLSARARVVGCFGRAPMPGELRRLRAQGLEIAEVRLDLANIKTPQAAAELMAQFAGVPAIATMRSAREGGKWQGDARARHNILKAVLPFADAVDIELAESNARAMSKTAAARGKTIIHSRHNIRGVDSPQTMDALAEKIPASGNDILKISCKVKTAQDLKILEDFLRRWRGKNIAITGMGESQPAKASRLRFPKLGSKLAFAAITKTAPGQLSLAQTKAACT